MTQISALPEQAAAIPFRRDVSGDVEVCLVRRLDSNRWSLPKGTVDRGDTHGQTALKETLEEAGLRGRLRGDSIGIYRYEKSGDTLRVTVYLMEVESHETKWDESARRERRWFPLSEAKELLAGHPASGLMDEAARMLATPPAVKSPWVLRGRDIVP